MIGILAIICSSAEVHRLIYFYNGSECNANEMRVDGRPITAALAIRQRFDTWQRLAFEQFQAGAATGRNVRHLRRQTGLLNCRCRVAAADDRRRALGGRIRQRPRDSDCARLAKDGSSKTPIGPFQTMVFAPSSA